MSTVPFPVNNYGDRVAVKHQLELDAATGNTVKIRAVAAETLTTTTGATMGFSGAAAGAQGAAITDALTAGSATAANCATTINLILAFLRTRGDIASA
jgi:hypothetical protein